MNAASPAPESSGSAQAFGVVIIGRNEGDRLKRCVASATALALYVVYVDSGSTDGSATWASQQGVSVVNLDMAKPFTAARARNEGFARLMAQAPELQFVQFVDGDCEIVDGWLRGALEFLRSKTQVAAAFGRRRERFPERSVYNRLCDQEWDRPVGRTRNCGGDVMMRAAALSAAGGYRDELIAGEEPELCVRLRAAGWEIWRLPLEMTLHDAAMTRFGQWWKRAMRGGFAFAEGAWLHGAPPERHGVSQTRSAVLWGVALPIVIVVLSVWQPAALWLLLAYPLQVLRLALRDGIGDPARRVRALFYVLSRFPEAQGVLKFWADRLRQRRSALIEYK
jgi:glycosyltransferase involved in cell wall biosynthesis